jgi:NADH dehydrogenase (ubiquinone) Fe-S protein 6
MPLLRATYTTEGSKGANVPDQKPVQNVSGTNTLPVSSKGAEDKALQEDLDIAEKRRTMQAPNREKTWAKSQNPREAAMVGPRFEQTIMEYQVR